MNISTTPVKSSQIAAIGYHPESKTLAVEFHGGGTYHYHDVSPEQFAKLQAAESVGRHFAQAIKGVHVFKKVSHGDK